MSEKKDAYTGDRNMIKILEQVDRLLAMLNVSGDSVMILADARKALGQVYRMAAEEGGGLS